MQKLPTVMAGTGCPRTNTGQHILEGSWCRQCGAETGIVTFVVYGNSQPAGSKRAFALRKGGVLTGRVAVSDDNPKSKDWKQQVAYAAREAYAGPLLAGPLKVSLKFYRVRPGGHFGKRGLNGKGLTMPSPTTKPDVLKLARAVEDALTGVVWRDDAQIVDEQISKAWGEPARCEVTIEPLAIDAKITGAGGGTPASLNTPSCKGA
jgi:Holliday junction resolvase RusA-like endonuclease